MTYHVGQKLGNYQLVRLLGRGGYAEVYLGKHIYLKTRAAIKMVHMRVADDSMESFLNEARTIARLEHPHIVRVLEFGMEDGQVPFLVMSYAPQGTLRQRHPKGSSLSPARVLSYVNQVASALQYAHERKVIHRDVKPENMLLGANDEVLLSDFGLAVVSQSSPQQNLHDRAGTTAYMAPEQLQGRPCRASDQYALAIVIYEWLCGRPPFVGSDLEIAIQHTQFKPPPLHEKLPGIPPVIEQAVMTALAKDPEQRFASVRDFTNTLAEACRPTASIISASTAILPGVSGATTPVPPEKTLFSPVTSGNVYTPHTAAPFVHDSQDGTSTSTHTPVTDEPLRFSESTRVFIPPPQFPADISSSTTPVPSEREPGHDQRFPRRAVVVGLLGVTALAVSGVGWRMLSQSRLSLPFTPTSTQTALDGNPAYTQHAHGTATPAKGGSTQNTRNITSSSSTPTGGPGPGATTTPATQASPTPPVHPALTVQVTRIDPDSVSKKQTTNVYVITNQPGASVVLHATYYPKNAQLGPYVESTGTTDSTGKAFLPWTPSSNEIRLGSGYAIITVTSAIGGQQATTPAIKVLFA
ncbi:MAG: serine/threonine protein kinase [Chloroflexota bacterium]|nr:serine/threonine protein kinase [Chloroflexota bacterium]